MLNKPQPSIMVQSKSGPKKGRRRNRKLRLRVFYEVANERQRTTAIMLLASMYRGVAVKHRLKELEREDRGQPDAPAAAPAFALSDLRFPRSK